MIGIHLVGEFARGQQHHSAWALGSRHHPTLALLCAQLVDLEGKVQRAQRAAPNKNFETEFN